jgi:hypothetical protein
LPRVLANTFAKPRSATGGQKNGRIRLIARYSGKARTCLCVKEIEIFL